MCLNKEVPSQKVCPIIRHRSNIHALRESSLKIVNELVSG